jgi:hypothetical protein
MAYGCVLSGVRLLAVVVRLAVPGGCRGGLYPVTSWLFGGLEAVGGARCQGMCHRVGSCGRGRHPGGSWGGWGGRRRLGWGRWRWGSGWLLMAGRRGGCSCRSIWACGLPRGPRRGDAAGLGGIARIRAGRGGCWPLVPVPGEAGGPRIADRAPGAPDVHLVDAELNLLAGKRCGGLGRLAVTQAARGLFAQASAAVASQAGVRLPTGRVQELTAGAGSGGFGGGPQRQPPHPAPGGLVGMACEGKGIVTLPGQLRPGAARKARRALPGQDGRLSRGGVRTPKRMADAGSVFTPAPAPRTASGIIRPPGACPAPR